jgi:hypothetical protein
MNTTMLRRVRRHFCSDLVPMHVNRANRRAWVRSVRLLGARWLLAKPMERRA